MRIGINASFGRKSGSGIGQVTINFIQELAKTSEFEYIVYLEEDLPEKIKLPANFRKAVFLPFWKRDDLIRKILWEKIYLPKKALQDKCDVFLSLYQCPTVMPKNIFHLMLVHDIIPKLFPEYLDNLRKKQYWNWTEKAIGAAQKIITVSFRTEKDLVQHLQIDAGKISVNYIDCDSLYKKPINQNHTSEVLKKYQLKPGYIYTGGGLEVRKNTENIVRAYKQLLEMNKNQHFIEELPKLVISGKLLPHLAPLVLDVEKLVQELNLSSYVKILDYVEQKDLPVLYQEANFFIYPSHYEGFGLPVLEAMAVGCPVITSKTSSLPEVGMDSVLYCNQSDIKDVAMVMKNMLLNQALRKTLKERGQTRSMHFSWKKFTQNMINQITAYKNF